MGYERTGLMILGDGKAQYYIHRHLKNFDMGGAVSVFNQQKKEGYQQAKARYNNNYIKSISGISDSAKQRLNDAMNSDEILKNLDREIVDSLNQSTSNAIKSFNLDAMLQNSYGNLNDAISNFTKNGDVKKINEIFKDISKASNILAGNKNEVTKILKNSGFLDGSGGNLNELYRLGKEQMAAWEGQVLTLNRSRLQSVLKSLTEMTGTIIGGASTAKSLQGYIKNIFSTQLGEYVVSRGVGKAAGMGLERIKKSMSGVKIVKTQNNEINKFIKDFGQKGNQVYKTDNNFSNFSISLNDGRDAFVVDLGITTKWYKNFTSADSSGVTITTETSFINRVNQMYNTPGEKYNAYNALGLVAQDESGYKALKASIIARNIDTLISGLGFHGDFSQVMVLNGNFISIMEIINIIENFNTGSGTSEFDVNSDDPVTISANGLTNISQLTEDSLGEKGNLMRAYIRSKEQNQLINNLSLSGHFYPNKMKRLLKT